MHDRVTESPGNAAEHNLDLSLGNSSSKGINSQTFGNYNTNVVTDQHMAHESNWRNGGIRPKVSTI